MTTDRLFFILGSLSAALSVGSGAFAAHGLRSRLTPEMLAVFETGSRYQMFHALGLLACAWAVRQWPGPLITSAGWLMVAGTVLFTGSLTLLALTGARGFGPITPLGGVCWLLAWVLLAAGVARAS